MVLVLNGSYDAERRCFIHRQQAVMTELTFRHEALRKDPHSKTTEVSLDSNVVPQNNWLGKRFGTYFFGEYEIAISVYKQLLVEGTNLFEYLSDKKQFPNLSKLVTLDEEDNGNRLKLHIPFYSVDDLGEKIGRFPSFRFETVLYGSNSSDISDRIQDRRTQEDYFFKKKGFLRKLEANLTPKPRTHVWSSKDGLVEVE